jgi:hypothetical protein
MAMQRANDRLAGAEKNIAFFQTFTGTTTLRAACSFVSK